MIKKDVVEILPEEAIEEEEQGIEEEEESFLEESLNQPVRKKKKRRKKHYFLKFLIFCGLVAGIIVFLSSSFFDVKKIEVENTSVFTNEQIVGSAGLKTGKNIFKVKKSKAVDRISKDPYIEKVTISKKMPSTLVIKVKERTAVATVPYGEEYILVDGKGVVLKKVSELPQLPVLLGLTIKKMDLGSPLEVKEEGVLEDTFSLLKIMNDSDLYFEKIDMSSVTIKAYIYDFLICKGKPKNIIENMENGNLELIVYDLYQKEITKGIIHIGDDAYCSFSPDVE